MKKIMVWLMTLFFIMSVNVIKASDSSPQRSAINLGIPVIEISNNQINNVQLRTTWPDADVIVELINSNATSPMMYADNGNYSNFWVTSFKADESPDYFQNLLAATEYNHNRWIERGAPERELFSNIAMLTDGEEELKNGCDELTLNSSDNSLKNATATADHLKRWREREASKTESFAPAVLTSCLQGLDYKDSWSNFLGESFFENASSLQIVASARGPITVLKEPMISFAINSVKLLVSDEGHYLVLKKPITFSSDSSDTATGTYT